MTNLLLHGTLAIFMANNVLFAQSPTLMKWVAPNYSIGAKIAEVSGVVNVKIDIDEFGKAGWPHAFGGANHQHLPYFAKACEEAATKWVFDPGPPHSNRILVVHFAFHLYPSETPDDLLKPELVEPFTVLVKAKVPKVEPMEISSSSQGSKK